MTAAATAPRGAPVAPAGAGRWARRIRFYAPAVIVGIATIITGLVFVTLVRVAESLLTRGRYRPVGE